MAVDGFFEGIEVGFGLVRLDGHIGGDVGWEDFVGIGVIDAVLAYKGLWG